MTLREYIFENFLQDDDEVVSIFENSQMCNKNCPIKKSCDAKPDGYSCWKIAEIMLDKEIDE